MHVLVRGNDWRVWSLEFGVQHTAASRSDSKQQMDVGTCTYTSNTYHTSIQRTAVRTQDVVTDELLTLCVRTRVQLLTK